MHSLLIFIVTVVISFVGSIQLGPLNIAVIQATVKHNLRAGVLVSMGGALPEFLFSAIAIYFASFFRNNPIIEKYSGIATIVFFAGFGLYYLFSENDDINFSETTGQQNNHLLKGFSLSAINPQLAIFWFLYSIIIDNYLKINGVASKVAFVLGAGTGAFLILYLFAYISYRNRSLLTRIFTQYPINKYTGILFLVLSFVQLLKIIL